jgi:hypothetical protein
MKLYSYGPKHRKPGKANSEIVADDLFLKPRFENGFVKTFIIGKRRYILRMTPEEIVRMVLALPPEELSKAVETVARSSERTDEFPEMIKQISVGTIAAMKPEFSLFG